MKRPARWLLLLVGQLAASIAMAQNTPPVAALVEVVGSVQIQTASGKPRPIKRGEQIRAGDIVEVGSKSSASIGFGDGQITVLSADSMLRIIRFNGPTEPGLDEIFLDLMTGSMRVVLGEIGERNPGAVRIQVGTATVTGDAPSSNARGTDAGIAVQGASAVLSVIQGGAALVLPSGQAVRLSAGQGAFLQSDGKLVQGSIAQVSSQAAQSSEGKQLVGQLRAAQSTALPEASRQTIIALATQPSPTSKPDPDAQAVAQALEKLPAPGAIGEEARAPIPPPPALATGTVQTSTGASGGGSQAVASPN